MSSNLKPRPLSPHLTVYKPQITSVLSILHRATGVFLSMGIPLIIYWLYSVAGGAEQYAKMQSLIADCLVLKLAIIAWCAAFYYHFCNGIRHLFWDMGKGFELSTLRASGIAVLVVATILTAATVFASGLLTL